jgi:dTDP-4-amino-4,6-dideoxygalactose transaminase
MEFLKEKEIETAIHYPTALPNLPAYSNLGYTRNQFPIASALESIILSLPIYPEMSENLIKHVVTSIQEFYQS